MAAHARRLCATLAAISIALLAGCKTPEAIKPVIPIPPPPPAPTAPHQLSDDSPAFLRLPNMTGEKTPLRVGVILPFSNGSAGTKALANAMLKAAQLALYDSGNRDMVLMTADDSQARPQEAAAAATRLLNQGAEIIIGPLFAGSVTAVAPIARDRGVPVLAFSTDRTVAGKGVYLLSFQPQNEVTRVVSYALAQGHKNFAAMVPSNSYGDVTERAFREAVKEGGGTVSAVERFPATGAGTAAAATAKAGAIAKTGADAVFIAQGGATLRGIAPNLDAGSGEGGGAKPKLLGTGLWDDLAITREPALRDGWFAAPAPEIDREFIAKYRSTFGAPPPQLAALAYDAVSLIALLGGGQPYHRFTAAALTDPNGFAGIDGIFRFTADGSIERGLSVLSVRPGGFAVISPAPATFQGKGS
jgi:ABC-type branched-subunit amino acid transport system substrate-binding protein